MSLSDTAGRLTSTPGRLTPLREPSLPPFRTSVDSREGGREGGMEGGRGGGREGGREAYRMG